MSFTLSTRPGNQARMLNFIRTRLNLPLPPAQVIIPVVTNSAVRIAIPTQAPAVAIPPPSSAVRIAIPTTSSSSSSSSVAPPPPIPTPHQILQAAVLAAQAASQSATQAAAAANAAANATAALIALQTRPTGPAVACCA